MEYLFNTDWRFCAGDVPDGSAAGYDDSGWRPLTLPHDWSIEGPYSREWASATGFLPGGAGWYRKTFDAPLSWEGQRISIEFDGVYKNCEVWLNGRSLGRRPNGFVSFRYDLTPHLRYGQSNVIAVRVDHTDFGDSRWYTGSGIYRNVRLRITQPVCIAPWGVSVSTPTVTAETAAVQVDVEFANHTASPVAAVVTANLSDDTGIVASARDTASIDAEGTAKVRLSMDVSNPRLWSPEHPCLYTLRTSVRCGGAEDVRETRVGIRSIHFDADEGFTLNGESVKMKGVCVHDDAGALGVAVPAAVWRRRLLTLKAAGVNAIRMSHNPHMPELYDLCDELGFLVQDEAFDEWELSKNKWIAGWNVGTPGRDGYAEHFAQWAEADLRDMLLQHRSHPCIVMWSIGNEIDYPNDPYTHEVLDEGTNPQIYGRGYQPECPHADRLGEIARSLAAIVKRFDDTRPVTAGLAALLISNETGCADALDAVGYNYQEYRYEADHAKYPDRVLYGSENGMHWEFWEAVTSHPYVCGQFLWTGIDYLGEAGAWPARSNTAGLLDLAGFPKPEFYFRKCIWSDEPMVYLGIRKTPEGEDKANLWSHKDAWPAWEGNEGESVRIVCFTNCEHVELTLNGRPVGPAMLSEAEGHVLHWDVPYQAGTLRAVGSRNGEAVAECERRTHGPASRLVACADTEILPDDADAVTHIEVLVVDEFGVPVPDAANTVHWMVEGPARLLGLESGDPESHEPYQASERRAYKGRLLGYLQGTGGAGDIVVTVSSPGLESAALALRIEER